MSTSGSRSNQHQQQNKGDFSLHSSSHVNHPPFAEPPADPVKMAVHASSHIKRPTNKDCASDYNNDNDSDSDYGDGDITSHLDQGSM